MRMGDNFIKRIYESPAFEKIEYQNDVQDASYGHRLKKGDTFLIGENSSEKYYMTMYHDETMEIWRKVWTQNGFKEERIAILSAYETECVHRVVDQMFKMVIFDDQSIKESS